MFKFEGTCGKCDREIVSSDGGATWKHKAVRGRKDEWKPLDHPAYPTGVIKQV